MGKVIGRFWIWRSDAAPTHQIGSQRVTPFVQSIGVRWRGGGWLWQFPLRIEVEDAEVEDAEHGAPVRLPIPDPTRTVVWFLLGLAFTVFLLAALPHLRNRRRLRQKRTKG